MNEIKPYDVLTWDDERWSVSGITRHGVRLEINAYLVESDAEPVKEFVKEPMQTLRDGEVFKCGDHRYRFYERGGYNDARISYWGLVDRRKGERRKV